MPVIPRTRLYLHTYYHGYIMQPPGHDQAYSLQPYQQPDPYSDGTNDGGHDYLLPNGYHIAADANGIPHIYPDGQEYPALLTIHRDRDGNPLPAIRTGERSLIILQPADEKER